MYFEVGFSELAYVRMVGMLILSVALIWLSYQLRYYPVCTLHIIEHIQVLIASGVIVASFL